VCANGTQVANGEAAGGLTVVGVATPSENAGPDTIERAATRQVGEAHPQGVVFHCRHNARPVTRCCWA
jgi:hypothetical protein